VETNKAATYIDGVQDDLQWGHGNKAVETN